MGATRRNRAISPVVALAWLLSGGFSCRAQSAAGRIAARIEPAAIRFTPITPRRCFHLYLRRSFGPEAVVRSAFGAAYGQLRDRPPEWGEGAAGFAHRFASGFAGHLTETTLEYGMSAALHEDNRHFVSGLSGAASRFAYAIESPFLARRSDGTRRVSVSHIGALVGAAFLSRAWQPRSTAGVRGAETNALVLVGSSMGFDVLREFWPRRP